MRKLRMFAILLVLLALSLPCFAASFDFPVAAIKVETGTVHWGPFAFDFTAAIPTGDALVSVAVKSTGPDGSTNTTAQLIDGAPSVSGNIVSLKFKYPGDTFVGNHTIRFTLTFASGAVNPFGFGYAQVEK